MFGGRAGEEGLTIELSDRSDCQIARRHEPAHPADRPLPICRGRQCTDDDGTAQEAGRVALPVVALVDGFDRHVLGRHLEVASEGDLALSLVLCKL